MRASIAATLVCDLTILTATVFTVLPEPLIPTASPLTTRPKHPAPSWIPKQFYIIAYEPSNKRYFICETEETYRVLVDFLGIPIACRMVTVQFVHPLVICYWFLSGSLQAVFLLPETLFCVSVQHGNKNFNVSSGGPYMHLHTLLKWSLMLMPIPSKNNTIRNKMNAIMEIISVPTSRNKTKLDIGWLLLSRKRK